MSYLALFEAKNRLTELVREAEVGASFELTRHGKPVAVLLGIDQYQTLQQARGAMVSDLYRLRSSWEGDDFGPDPFLSLRSKDPGRAVEL